MPRALNLTSTVHNMTMTGLNGGINGSVSGAFLDRRFLEALGKSIGVIGASEIGDKTFFIAAIMAMRNPRWTVSALEKCGHARIKIDINTFSCCRRCLVVLWVP